MVECVHVVPIKTRCCEITIWKRYLYVRKFLRYVSNAGYREREKFF